jgi:transposase
LADRPIPEALEERIREARRGGLSVRKAAAKFGVSPGTVLRIPFAHVAGASAAAG